MPISTNDPQYRAEFIPASIAAMGPRLRAAYGVGADAFGSKGNTSHSSGYHRSRRWVLLSPDSVYGTGDYSVQLSADHGGNGDAVSAFDFTPGEWGTAENRRRMIEITTRVRAAARANDPRLRNLREFAGTEDGSHVVTFYCQGGGSKTPFDSSHLDHCHGSLWRDKNENDHSGIIDVMLGAGTAAGGNGNEDDDMAGSFGPVLMRADDDQFPMVIPPVSGGLADPRATWLNIAGDFGLPAHLRIYVSKGDGNFTPIVGSDGVVAVEAGKAWSHQLASGVRVLSVLRVTAPGSAPDTKPSRAPISFCFERQ